MISPEMWFTLYALAKKGAVYRRQTLTTRELGEMLGVSQQTASRRIAECVNEGLVSRVHSVGGMIVQVTDRGREMLRQVLADLEAAFVPPSDEIIIEGIVTAGLGEGAYYVDIYSSRFEQALGF
ncbi:MAG: MarR family transcriptional regulator, partial [Candidatus Thorarchaeota archaeon]